MLSTWISKLFGKSDTNIYIAKIQIAHSRQKDRRIATKANVQPSSKENWISQQFIEEHDLLGGLNIPFEQLENRVETFTWYYCTHQNGHIYTCEFTSRFRITRQRGCGVLFGSNPTDGDNNGGDNPFKTASLKKRTSWKPFPPITTGSTGKRSLSSSTLPRLLDEETGRHAATKQEPKPSVGSSIPKDIVVEQSAGQAISSETPTQTSAPHSLMSLNPARDLRQATKTTHSEATVGEKVDVSSIADMFCQMSPSSGQDNTPTTWSLKDEGDMTPIGIRKDVMHSATAAQWGEENQPSVPMARYLDSPLELAKLEDGDRTGRPGPESIHRSKPRKRRKEERADSSRIESSKQQGPQDNQDSQYWQYDVETDGYFHKDLVSNEIVWYPMLD